MIVIDGLHPSYLGNRNHFKLLGSLMNFCLIPQGPQGGYPNTVLVIYIVSTLGGTVPSCTWETLIICGCN
jgi:hypothetical protein